MGSNWEKIEANIWRSTTEEKKYKVDLYYGRDERGRMKRSSKVVKGNLTDARNLLKLHEADRVKKVIQAPTKKTLSQVFSEWETIGDGADNEETTKTSNENIERHIFEYFGDIRVDKITTTMVREYMAYLKDVKGLSNNTINKHRTRLNTVFNYILTVPEEYGIYKNPIEVVNPYKVVEAEFEIYEPEEAKELLLSLHKTTRHDFEVAVNIGLCAITSTAFSLRSFRRRCMFEPTIGCKCWFILSAIFITSRKIVSKMEVMCYYAISQKRQGGQYEAKGNNTDFEMY